MTKILVGDDGSCLLSYQNHKLFGEAKNQFAHYRSGNKAEPCISGQDYYAKLVEDMRGAKEEINIVGWQVNWDVQLKPEDPAESGLRLYDLIKEVVTKNENLIVRVMIWSGDTKVLYTYAPDTQKVLETINQQVGRDAVYVQLSNTMADDTPMYFSHHQKFVVIDRKIAFLGGMDLAHGRYDNARYDLHPEINPELKKSGAMGRQMLNRYNSCIAGVGKYREGEIIDPDLLTGLYDRWFNRDSVIEKINQGAWQGGKVGEIILPNYINNETLDLNKQPRMPWQDVQVRFEGPAVLDLLRNFALRWNCQASVADYYPIPTIAECKDQSTAVGNVDIQVLRSVSKVQCNKEHRIITRYAPDELPFYPKKEDIGIQSEIYQAMRRLIQGAQNYIYIENQFFTSFYGEMRDFDKDLSIPAQQARTTLSYKERLSQALAAWPDTYKNGEIHNLICQDLGERIYKHILNEGAEEGELEGFHVYIVLPVYPEGELDDTATMSTIFHTMQALVHGEKSLLKQIRRAIRVMELINERNEGESDNGITTRDAEKLADSEFLARDDRGAILMEDYKKCQKYVSLLNLRNWEKIGGNYVTEQIYVHSKMMVVDDRYALIGSANISDRSMLGTRDSEVAVLMIDGEGDCHSRKVAKALRQNLWKKILGASDSSDPDKSPDPIRKKIDEGLLKHIMEYPYSERTIEAINQIAEDNSRIYDKMFNFIPRNYFGNSEDEQFSSIFPTLDSENINKGNKIDKKTLPLYPEFWANYVNSDKKELGDTQGYITQFPIFWGNTENNNTGMAEQSITQNDNYHGIDILNQSAEEVVLASTEQHKPETKV
ncbi:phospholipase D-like domain-containing protein [Limnobaculum parvum]|uniref:PLD phosphodiesterase domain-containing protein n=1 Tax=Limnobaculum parvum TaxID=2172103 RepID=A0A2Y9TUD8_9GAMM|nr:phospholipase D-like domain-containing protein [Limnobaculum parvum]AWH87256.1 hypothetical protein HYN51_00990 [Limnobaculum parvum]